MSPRCSRCLAVGVFLSRGLICDACVRALSLDELEAVLWRAACWRLGQAGD